MIAHEHYETFCATISIPKNQGDEALFCAGFDTCKHSPEVEGLVKALEAQIAASKDAMPASIGIDMMFGGGLAFKADPLIEQAIAALNSFKGV